MAQKVVTTATVVQQKDFPRESVLEQVENGDFHHPLNLKLSTGHGYITRVTQLPKISDQVTQNLDCQLQTVRYPVMNKPPNAPELLLSKNLHGPATQLLRLVTPHPLAVQL